MTLLEIVTKLAHTVQGNKYIHAMWLEGSYATGQHTERSDIDVWLDVDDGTFDACVEDFRQELNAIIEIENETTRGIYSTSPKLTKYAFFLKGFPKEQVIELELQEHSRQFRFSKNKNVIKVLFDKDDTIKWTY